MPPYNFDENNRFIIFDYQHQNPFSSTLPGIAGHLGIPIWVFYVNRGQGIASFGTENKDHPIMEFQPANKAYQSTSTVGFRTFIKINGQEAPVIYEPFAAHAAQSEQKMIISFSELELQEISYLYGLKIEVNYFVLPYEKVSGLVRQLKVTNTSEEPVEMEILDGLPIVIPYGVSNYDLKEYHRTIEAWMEVCNLENNTPYFHCRSLPDDKAEVKSFDSGNFAYAMAVTNGKAEQLQAMVNPEIIFGLDTSYRFPAPFTFLSIADLNQLSYYPNGRTPCAFFGHPTRLAPNEQTVIYSIYGNARNLDLVKEMAPKLGSESFYFNKRREANQLIADLIDPIKTKTALSQFDAYCQQTFLDNNLRGGWPFLLGDDNKKVVYHMYSRKHGDPERDYNAFYLASEYYSQGNGNYRDVCQNRRSEVWFAPFVGDSNILSFTSLIQTDGYNPLTVKGSKFFLPSSERGRLLGYTENEQALGKLLEKPFTPGGLLKKIADLDINLSIPIDEFLNHALSNAKQYYDADFGEGYWTDHWIYILDLIMDYLSIFPDHKETVLFNKKSLPFFETSIFVQPRSKKYVLANGRARQFGALKHDEDKAKLIGERLAFPNHVRSNHGKGEIYRTNLFTKLLILSILKYSTLDPMGMGIEMEADKPSWCDALNGLPGLFGSSMADSFDLLRLLNFLQEHLSNGVIENLELPIEISDLLQKIQAALRDYQENQTEKADFIYWDCVSSAREMYRENTRLGLDGMEKTVEPDEIKFFISQMIKKLKAGIERALKLNAGIPPTYFFYEVEDFDYRLDPDGKRLTDQKGRPLIRVLNFKQKPLPIFIEGAVRYLKTVDDLQTARELYLTVKKSSLYDRKLKMYKTNVSLAEESMDIGRLRAFTPGWLENESIFLHMEYKYLLEILRSGLYDEFFEDMHNALVAFQDPARYRRSPLENSSFLVSSAHPDEKLHGAGFVARLTGATAEFLSMYEIMMAGHVPFRMNDGRLQLNLRPKLPGWLFDEDGKISFTFLGKCDVTYHNPTRNNTYDQSSHICKIRLLVEDEIVDLQGDVIESPYAQKVRDGIIRKIDVHFA
jgi:hypothetical protein